jgi:hypothetical protein
MKLSTFKRKFNKAHKLNYNVYIDFKNGFFNADYYYIGTDYHKKSTRIFFYQADKYIGAINLFDIEEVS